MEEADVQATSCLLLEFGAKGQAAVVARTQAANFDLHIFAVDCERRGIPFLPFKRKIEKDEKGNENNKVAPPRRWRR